MGIRILKGGMLTTVQDSGRPGYQSSICTVEIFSHFVAAVPEAAATSHFPVIWKSRSLWEAALPTSNVDLEDLRDAAS